MQEMAGAPRSARFFKTDRLGTPAWSWLTDGGRSLRGERTSTTPVEILWTVYYVRAHNPPLNSQSRTL